MADQVTDTVEGDGYAVATLDGMGEGYGFRKVRRVLSVEEFGINAIVIPPGYSTPRHYHEEQEEVYFVHQGEMTIEFDDGKSYALGPGGCARVAAHTVRQLKNTGDGDAVYVAVGAKGGYVGRDGRNPEADETASRPASN